MNAEWLKKQFDQNPEKSKSGLARAIGIDAPAISKILAGARQIKAREYLSMRQYFGLSTEHLQESTSNQNQYVLSTLKQNNGFADKNSTSDHSEWTIPQSIIKNKTDAHPSHLKTFIVEENTMEPDFKHGDVAIVDLTDKKPSPPGVFLVSDGFGYMLRQCEYVANSKPAKIKISANNTNFHPQTLKESEFLVIGRIIGKVQWL